MRVATAILSAAAIVFAASCASPVSPTDSKVPAAAGRYGVQFAGAGVTIGGVLYRPDIPSGQTRPGIIVLHGWLEAGKNGAVTVEPIVKALSDRGYVALAMSMRGWTPSNGADDCGLNQPDDVGAAARWLREQPGVDSAHVGVAGFSQGGQVSLLSAAREADVQAVVAYYPVTDVALWKTTTAVATIPDYISAICEPGGVVPRSPRFQAARIHAPVLLVHGDADVRVPFEQSRLLRDAMLVAGKDVSLMTVPGAPHGFSPDSAFGLVAQPVVEQFLFRYLGR